MTIITGDASHVTGGSQIVFFGQAKNKAKPRLGLYTFLIGSYVKFI